MEYFLFCLSLFAFLFFFALFRDATQLNVPVRICVFMLLIYIFKRQAIEPDVKSVTDHPYFYGFSQHASFSYIFSDELQLNVPVNIVDFSEPTVRE